MEQRYSWLVPSVPVLLFVLVFWQALLFMPQMLNADGDLPLHLAIGDSILTTAQIPTRDIFSHTRAGAIFFPHEWLSEVFFAMLYRAAGLNGVAWLTATVLGLTYAVLAYALRDSGVRALVALGGAYAASIVGAIHQLPRPHIFGTLAFTLSLLVLEHHRRMGNRRVLFWLVPTTLLWANIHGGFVFGLGLVGVYIFGALLEKNSTRASELFGALTLLALVSLINPNGVEAYVHSFGFAGRFFAEVLNEYQSPDFHGLSSFPFLLLLVFSIALGWRVKRELVWTHWILLVTWTPFALYAARNIPLYAQVALVVLAPIADQWLNDALPRIGRIASGFEPAARLARGEVWGVVIAAVLIALEANGATLDLWHEGNIFEPRKFPIAAVEVLKEDLPDGQMFNEYDWGGYLLYRLYPREKVFIDGRTDFYGEQVTRDYLKIINGEAGWEKILEQYGAKWVIIPPTRPLAERLTNSANWILSYHDDTAEVWVRK